MGSMDVALIATGNAICVIVFVAVALPQAALLLLLLFPRLSARVPPSVRVQLGIPMAPAVLSAGGATSASGAGAFESPDPTSVNPVLVGSSAPISVVPGPPIKVAAPLPALTPGHVTLALFTVAMVAMDLTIALIPAGVFGYWVPGYTAWSAPSAPGALAYFIRVLPYDPGYIFFLLVVIAAALDAVVFIIMVVLQVQTILFLWRLLRSAPTQGASAPPLARPVDLVATAAFHARVLTAAFVLLVAAALVGGAGCSLLFADFGPGGVGPAMSATSAAVVFSCTAMAPMWYIAGCCCCCRRRKNELVANFHLAATATAPLTALPSSAFHEVRLGVGQPVSQVSSNVGPLLQQLHEPPQQQQPMPLGVLAPPQSESQPAAAAQPVSAYYQAADCTSPPSDHKQPLPVSIEVLPGDASVVAVPPVPVIMVEEPVVAPIGII